MADSGAVKSVDKMSSSLEEFSRVKSQISRVDSDTEELLQYGDNDMAAQYATQGKVEISQELSNRLRRKADIYICIMLILIYAVQYMDKISSGSASILGLREDLNMTGHMYSWVGSSFYLGYIVFEIPMVSLLQKFPVAKTIGVIICIWGVILASSGACHNYSSYIATRTLLGAFEGAITPACILLTSQWYKRSEQYSRVLFWFGAGNGLGEILCNLIAYGLANRLENVQDPPLEAWRLLFIILGSVTVFLGIVFVLHVPDNPSQAWFLNEEERRGQVERIRENMQGYGNRHIKWSQVKETLLDVRTYLVFVIVVLCQLPNGGITNFNAIIIHGMGYSEKQTLLMSIPNGAVQFVLHPCVGILTLFLWNRRRMYYAISGSLGAVLATGLLAFGPNNGSRLAGIYLWCFTAPVFYMAMLSILVTNSAGHTKKNLTSALTMIGYCVGNVIGPQTFKPSEAPTYSTATATMVACYAVDSILLVILLYINRRANKIREQRNEKLPSHILNPEFADLTDKQNPEFRYAI